LSGICGIVRFDGAPVLRRDIERQLRALAHRGPDGAHAICDGGIGFGRLALRVTREDRFEVQPHASPDGGLLLVADLRLDNRDALAASLGLGPNAPADLPDSALLLAAYRRWGEDCASHLVGDFAFAVWDGHRRQLLLGRDHMGQRHLFYHRGADFLAFATEIKGLWALPDVPRALSEIGLARRVLVDRRRPASATLFEGIEALPGGVVITVDAFGAATSRRYWEPHAAQFHLGRDEAYYRQAYREVLAEAVACRLRRADRPAALCLSGGFDSAAIAALAAPWLQGRKLIALTSIDTLDPEAAQGAKRWADLCRGDMPHLDLRYVTRDGLSALSGAERLSLVADGPPSPNAYATDEMCRSAAAAGARVLLDGFGGDYTLNPRADRALARWLFAGRLWRFASEFRAQRRRRREPLWRSLRRDVLAPLLPRGWFLVWRRWRTAGPTWGAIHPVAAGFADAAIAQGVVPAGQDATPAGTRPRELSLHTLRVVQNAQAIGGILPGAHGLELTQPFHDKRVVELALAIPEDLYFRAGASRYLARTALADVYPLEFQDREPGNTPLIPDYPEMVQGCEVMIAEDIARMESSVALSRYFDFPRMRALLRQTPAEIRGRLAGSRVRQAMRTLLCARYVEWFNRQNAA
jgi:asparagine synthase (glutamine-hydrolysing)